MPVADGQIGTYNLDTIHIQRRIIKARLQRQRHLPEIALHLQQDIGILSDNDLYVAGIFHPELQKRRSILSIKNSLLRLLFMQCGQGRRIGSVKGNRLILQKQIFRHMYLFLSFGRAQHFLFLLRLFIQRPAQLSAAALQGVIRAFSVSAEHLCDLPVAHAGQMQLHDLLF